jgi:hypothetical protein
MVCGCLDRKVGPIYYFFGTVIGPKLLALFHNLRSGSLKTSHPPFIPLLHHYLRSLLMSSPASSPVIHRKPRAVQSCLHCRGKKLKCDRQQPCGQCLKRNRVGTDGCVYNERAGSLGGFEESSRPFKIAKTLPPSQPAGLTNIHAIPNARRDPHIVQNEPPGQKHRALHQADTIVQADRELARKQDTDNAEKRYHGLSNTRSLVALVGSKVPARRLV